MAKVKVPPVKLPPELHAYNAGAELGATLADMRGEHGLAAEIRSAAFDVVAKAIANRALKSKTVQASSRPNQRRST